MQSIKAALTAAMRSALNKAVTKARVASSRAIREEYNIKAKRLSRGMSMGKARGGRLSSSISTYGKPIPLYEFAARANKKGVAVKVLKKGTYKTIAHVFLADMPKSSHRGIYKRISKKRLPIKELYSVDIAAMFNSIGVDAADKIIDVEMYRLIEHEIDYYLDRIINVTVKK